MTALLFSRDGRWLISGSDDGQIWRRERSGREARMLATLSTQVRTLDLTGDGRLLAALGTDGGVWLWSLESGLLQQVYRNGVAALDVAFSPDGALLAAAGIDKRLHLWSIGRGHGHAHSSPGLHAWLETLTTATLLPGNLPGTP